MHERRTFAALFSLAFSDVVAMRVLSVAAVAAATSVADLPCQDVEAGGGWRRGWLRKGFSEPNTVQLIVQSTDRHPEMKNRT